MNSETRRLSWKIKVSITSRLQYDTINGDKHTRAWIHKTPRFLGEFQEIKRLEITKISIVDESETKLNEATNDKTNKMTFAPSEDSDQPGHMPRVWSEALLCALMIAKDLSFPHVNSEDSDQTGRMPRFIWVFAGRTCHFVGLVVRRLKYNKMNVISMLSIGSSPYRQVRLNFRVPLSTYSVSSKDS